jgi:hypothetical protein
MWAHETVRVPAGQALAKGRVPTDCGTRVKGCSTYGVQLSTLLQHFRRSATCEDGGDPVINGRDELGDTED